MIHIGDLIRKEVDFKRLTYKEFGALIHRNEKTIPDIYDRESMSTDLLITISGALKKDFLSVYYTEEPLKSLRDDEFAKLSNQFQVIAQEYQKVFQEIKQLEKELALTKQLVEAQKEIISFAKTQIADLKSIQELLKKEKELTI